MVSSGHLDAVFGEQVYRARLLADEMVPRARLGINVVRDLAQAQGR